ncbi:MAG TPA: phosphodiester glycosidase family protein [Actinomycetota bacterium]|nr:phosphodiester glycosidase family protein [Actinomycetota bacterium]
MSVRVTRWMFVAWTTVLLAAVPAASVDAADPMPKGFARSARTKLAHGVTHEVYVRRSPALIVNVARVARDAAARWRVVQASDVVGGGKDALEPASAMCRRIRCVVAVNADFFTPQGMPVGAVVSDGEPLHSPNARHHQLAIARDGALRAGQMEWTVRLVPTDLEDVAIDAVNKQRRRDEIVMYTASAGASTRTNAFGSELVARIVHPGDSLRVGSTSVVRLESFHPDSGDTVIPQDGFVLSGHGKGAAALARLWKRVRTGEASTEALLRVTSDPTASESVGGTPILLRDGKRWFADENREFVRARAPRTAVGWTPAGETLVVTIDGRQPGYSTGATLAETAAILRGLGARDAINLDGGGSTTFVRRGAVANRPSDRLVKRGAARVVVAVPRAKDRVLANVERPVANVLALVLDDGSLGRVPMSVQPPRLDAGPVDGAAGDAASDPSSASSGGLVSVPAGDAASTPVTLAIGLAAVLGAVWLRRSKRSPISG